MKKGFLNFKCTRFFVGPVSNYAYMPRWRIRIRFFYLHSLILILIIYMKNCKKFFFHSVECTNTTVGCLNWADCLICKIKLFHLPTKCSRQKGNFDFQHYLFRKFIFNTLSRRSCMFGVNFGSYGRYNFKDNSTL